MEWSPTHRTLHPGFAARFAGSGARGDQTINISNPRSHHIYDGKTGEETAISSELCNRFDRLMLFNTEREKEFDKIKYISIICWTPRRSRERERGREERRLKDFNDYPVYCGA